SAPGKRFSGDGKVTDMLIEAADAETEAAFAEKLAAVEQRFLEIEAGLKTGIDVQALFEEIEHTYREGSAAEMRDYLVSRGEYVASRLLAAYLGYDFIDAASVIFFDEGGKYDPAATEAALRPELRKHERAVVPGFYGSLPNGHVETFSRGGSDLSGAIVTAAAAADLYENWTDVSGLLMADPKIVHDPVSVPVITYRELRELSYLGAAVMHQDTVFPVAKLDIPIQIRNTNKPEEQGTLIVKNARYYGNKMEISGISGRQGFVGVTIEDTGLGENLAAQAEVAAAFGERNIRIASTLAGIDSITLVVNGQDLSWQLIEEIREDLAEHYPQIRFSAEPGLSVIGIVGRELGSSPEAAVKVLTALNTRRIGVKFIDHGAQKMNMTLAVSDEDYVEAVKAIYEQFARAVKVTA
ncbi:MAG: homoserine O-succinyltransferase, partial [Eubacterium sp.]|nr:homoserine O-succinyltransferase [Eubacterium sp.]